MSLETKIKQLKEDCSKYESKEFLTFLAGLMLQIPTRHQNPYLKKLDSPFRQLFYLALLNSQRESTENQIGVPDQEWDNMATLLHEIEMEYFYLLGFPKRGNESREDLEKIKVTMPTFMHYFFNGPLAYQEQEIERIQEIFKNFETDFKKEWDLTIKDFIAFFELINDQMNENLRAATEYLNPVKWHEFTTECINKGLTPDAWLQHAPEEVHASIQFFRNPGSFLAIKVEKLDYSSITKERFNTILQFFSYESKPALKIPYYNDENDLLKKPFVQLTDSTFLPFFIKQYLNACHEFLFNKCKTINQDKLFKARDNFIEDKSANIFKTFFGKEAFIYKNYSIDNNKHEQDILILYKKIAIVVEVKAASYRPPMRDPSKAFDKLKSDFEESIQYAYTQVSRVCNAFKSQERIYIKDKRGKALYEFNPRKYYVYTIITTLERFGHIQTNLAEMLNINYDDDYPWCVSIDDLEAFMLTLKKRRDKIQAFFTFLTHRKYYHGHLLFSDELELCGLFLSHENDFKANSTREETAVIYPDLTGPIEQSYRDGMGFTNERYLKEKRSGHTLFLYDDRPKQNPLSRASSTR